MNKKKKKKKTPNCLDGVKLNLCTRVIFTSLNEVFKQIAFRQVQQADNSCREITANIRIYSYFDSSSLTKPMKAHLEMEMMIFREERSINSYTCFS